MTDLIRNTFKALQSQPQHLESLNKDALQQLNLAVQNAINGLDQGTLKITESNDSGELRVNEWLKEAILLYFRLQKLELIEVGPFRFYDKIPLKSWKGTEGVRVVPQALVRYGAHVEPGAILMPSYVNIGARVGSGTMVDTWATVGSCASIGKAVHLSGGVGIGGVLEPVQARPVVIEDDVFVGSRAIIVEGVRVRKGAVIGAGVTLTASTRIIDVSQKDAIEFKGEIPENSVVIPGTRPRKFAAGEFQIPCVLIIGKRSQTTDQKTSLTQALRDFEIPV